MIERWAPVDGYPYEVSNLGAVRRVGAACGATPGKVLKGDTQRSRTSIAPYVFVRLCNHGTSRMFAVHRLVASAFLGPAPSVDAEVNHIDGNPQNNSALNLEWTTRAGNARNAYATGLQTPKGTKGESHAKAKLTDALVRELRELKAHGWSGTALAKALGIDPKTVNSAINGTTWGHVR